MRDLSELLEQTASEHRHLCPRQVLGVRIGLLGGRITGIPLPQSGKRLLVIAEMYGCAVDGISVVTGCTVGHRTLRIEDFGKLAATFVDTETCRSFRIVPRCDIRARASQFASAVTTRWEAQLLGYQHMPDETMFHIEDVELTIPIEKLVSRAGKKVECAQCGEEITNEREILRNGVILCAGCAGASYYRLREPKESVSDLRVMR